MALQSCLVRQMGAASCRTLPPRAQPFSPLWRKGDIVSQPEHVPRYCSYQTLTTYCTGTQAERGLPDEIVGKSHQCALPFVLYAWDWGMGSSTSILKRVGQSSLPRPVPQLRHKHTHGRYPNACRGLSRQGANKMSWRHCSLPGQGLAGSGFAVPGMVNGLGSGLLGRAEFAASHQRPVCSKCRSSASHEGALLQLK